MISREKEGARTRMSTIEGKERVNMVPTTAANSSHRSHFHLSHPLCDGGANYRFMYPWSKIGNYTTDLDFKFIKQVNVSIRDIKFYFWEINIVYSNKFRLKRKDCEIIRYLHNYYISPDY